MTPAELEEPVGGLRSRSHQQRCGGDDDDDDNDDDDGGDGGNERRIRRSKLRMIVFVSIG